MSLADVAVGPDPSTPFSLGATGYAATEYPAFRIPLGWDMVMVGITQS